jgi:hypothetical protein
MDTKRLKFHTGRENKMPDYKAYAGNNYFSFSVMPQH